MAMQATQARSYKYVALVGGAASLVAAAFWSATYGRAIALGGHLLAPASWPLLIGALGLLACAVVMRVKRGGLPLVLRREGPAAGDQQGHADFAGRAERVGELCRQLEDDGDMVLQLLDNISTGFALLDHEKQVLRVNLTFCLLFNLKPEAVEGRPLRDILPASFLARWSPRFLRTGDDRGEEVAEVSDPASGRVLRTTLAKIRSVKRGPELLALLVEEVAGKRSVPADASYDQPMSRQILDGIREAIVLAGPEATILDLNGPAAEMLGYGRSEALGLPLQNLLAPNPDSPAGEGEHADIFTGEWKLHGRVVDLPLIRQDRRVFPAELTFGDWGEGGRRRLLISMRDTTAGKQADLLAEDRLRVIEMMSQNQPSEAILAELTQLAEHQIPGSRCAVLLRRGGCLHPVAAPGLAVDLLENLDGLPVDTWRVSNTAGKALAGSVLVSDIAGGQFPAGFCTAAADRGYRTCWASPIFSVEGLVIGFVAVFRRKAGSPTAPEQGHLEVASRLAAACLGQQDARAARPGRANQAPQSRRSARLAAVPAGPGGSAPERGPVPQHRLDVQAGLKRALDRGEFSLHFQPQFHLATEEMAAVEALLRWEHPQLGLILPSRFIPAAEESGLIVPIGAWVLREACRHVRTLPQNGKGRQRVAVNVSGLHFARPDFLEHVRLAVQESGVPAGMLELELPEDLLIENAEDWAGRMARLRDLGVRITVEGFGADYSSMRQVPHLPVDSLKIGRCFVEHLAGSNEGPLLVRSIAALAGSLHMEATAPCVETQEQLEILESSGCACVQGYLFGAPLTGDELRQQAATLSLRGTSGAPRSSPPRLQPAGRSGVDMTAVA